MNYHFVRIDEKNAGDYLPFFDPAVLEEALGAGKAGRVAGLADEGGHPVGAASALVEKDAFWITSLYVDPAARNQGAGTRLLNGMIALAARAGRQSVYLEYPTEDTRELDRLLMENRFRVRADLSILRCPLEALRSALDRYQPADSDGLRLTPLDQLPVDLQLQLRSRLTRELPPNADPAKAPGKPVPSACLAALRNGQLAGHTVCTLSPDGLSALLDGIYLQPEAADLAMPLLHAALNNLCTNAGTAEEFIFEVDTTAELRLLQYIKDELGLEEETQDFHTAILTRKGENTMLDLDPDALLPLVMPRLNGLVDTLTDLGMEARLMMGPEQDPYVDLDRNGQTLRLRYQPLGQDRYLLAASLYLPISPEQDQDQLSINCQVLNSATLGPVCTLRTDLNELQIHAVLPEAGGLSAPEVLSFFLELFWNTVDQFAPPTI